MPDIQIRIEGARGCGFRKKGGIYVVAGTGGQGCGRMPMPLTICPTCNQGIKPARGWTWLDPAPLLEVNPCATPAACGACPLGGTGESMHYPVLDIEGKRMVDERGGDRIEKRVGLIWIGEKFYATPEDFLAEANSMGISRRIKTVPRGFVVGKTWVWLAHRKGIVTETLNEDGDPERVAGVFQVFLPTAIEYVVKGTETEDDLDALEARGLTLVDVRQAEEQPAQLQLA
jgi:hypothetical protein